MLTWVECLLRIDKRNLNGDKNKLNQFSLFFLLSINFSSNKEMEEKIIITWQSIASKVATTTTFAIDDYHRLAINQSMVMMETCKMDHLGKGFHPSNN